MTDENKYHNNPLHGLSLKNLLTEIVNHYDFDILFAYMNINCFKTNPSIESSVKFIKKTDWAREKVEAFYLYQFKNLPKVSSEQFALPPRERIIPADQEPGNPAVLSLEDAEQQRIKLAAKAAAYNKGVGRHSSGNKRVSSRRGGKAVHRDTNYVQREPCEPSSSSNAPSTNELDPWANWREK